MPPIQTDRTLLTQVVRNLLTNAVKFTPHGVVGLAARQPTPLSVEITVSDSGIGIAATDQPRIFEEFFQVRGPLQADQKGTGLGLPYARRVIETLGGRIRVESALGRGSAFTVELATQWQPLLSASRSPGRNEAAGVKAG